MHLDIATTLALVLCLSVLLLGWRARHSPGVDRALLEDHSRLKARVSGLEEGLKGCATRADMTVLSTKIDALEEHTASAADINALEGKINAVMIQVGAVEKAADRTEAGVSRIEGYLMQRGIDR